MRFGESAQQQKAAYDAATEPAGFELLPEADGQEFGTNEDYEKEKAAYEQRRLKREGLAPWRLGGTAADGVVVSLPRSVS